MIPLFVNYKLSDRCDLACDLCQLATRETEEEFPTVAMVTEDLKALKRQGTRIINFTGGDPLLHPDIATILRTAKAMRFFIVITTSGIHYTSFSNGLKGLADLMVFLLYSPEQAVHDARAEYPSFSLITDALAFAREQGVRAICAFPITRETVQTIPEMYDFAVEKKTLLWLNPIPSAFGVSGFDQETLAYIRYHGRKPNAWVNLETLLRLSNTAGLMSERPDCLMNDEQLEQAFERGFIPFLITLWSMAVLFWKFFTLRK